MGKGICGHLIPVWRRLRWMGKKERKKNYTRRERHYVGMSKGICGHVSFRCRTMAFQEVVHRPLAANAVAPR